MEVKPSFIKKYGASRTYSYCFSIVNRVLRPTGVISRVFIVMLFLYNVRWIVLMLMELMLEKICLLFIADFF